MSVLEQCSDGELHFISDYFEKVLEISKREFDRVIAANRESAGKRVRTKRTLPRR